MKLGFLIAGLIFLFNPHVAIIDVLPDAIGYGLILYGILPVSRVDPYFSDSARRFRYLAVTGLVKLAAIYLYSLVSSDEMLFILIASMLFGTLEIFFGIGAWKDLFEGVENHALREENPAVFTHLKRVRLFTLIFTVVKPVMAVLPDLTLLDNGQYGEITATGIKSLQAYRGVFTVLSVVIVAVVGIVWLALAIGYFRGIRKDKAYLDRVNAVSGRYFLDEKKVRYQSLMLSLTLIFYALIFCLEFKVEGYSLLPPMIGGVLFLAFFLLRAKQLGRVGKWGIVSSSAYLCLSLAGWILGILFADRYYIEDVGGGFSDVILSQIDRYFKVFDRLLGINVIVLLSQVALAGVLVCLFLWLKGVIASDTGVVESLISEKDKTDAMREHEAASDRAIKRGLYTRLPAFLALGGLTVTYSALFPLLQVYFQGFFTVDLIARAVFVIYALLTVGKIRSAVKVKYGRDFDE